MSSSNSVYTTNQISTMNGSYPWNGALSCAEDLKSSSGLYELHATGDADLDGRKYVALPKETNITEDVKRKYNLM